MHGYTLSAIGACAAVVALELVILRTGLLRRRTYWVSLGIILFFQALVDGWLTKLTAPIVLYAGSHLSGLRLPWDIPVEDFAFGWAMCTLCLLAWEAQAEPDDEAPTAAPVVHRTRR